VESWKQPQNGGLFWCLGKFIYAYAMNLHTKQLSTRCKCMVEEDFVRFE